ncbi:MAG: GAF domain-containing protein [Anaerolineales bacterium]|nr:GAF domain-containing protein [Anaerolineales bacterium]
MDPNNAASIVSDESAIRNYPRLLARYERLLELSSDLASTLDLTTLLDHIVNAAKELTECEEASLLLYDPQRNNLIFKAATNKTHDQFDHISVPINNSVAGWIYSEQQPLLVSNVVQDDRFFQEVDIITDFETKSILGVPLLAKDKTIGVIEVINRRIGTFQPDDTLLLQSLAAQAAIAIENSRLFQQSDLIAEMVHELRTPLASLIAGIHLLRRADLPNDQYDRVLDTIYSEVQRLNEMSTDFLELARLESGRVHFCLEHIHLEGLIHECLEIIRAQAVAKGIRLETSIDHNIAPVHGDRSQLKRLLLNLLTNAIKYNKPEGSITISLMKQEDVVRLDVTDSGIGIAPEDIERIFKRFYRVPAQAGEISGTGLGLVIAEHIVQSHQGIITVESVEGEGSTFSVRLPLRQIQSEDQPRLPN